MQNHFPRNGIHFSPLRYRLVQIRSDRRFCRCTRTSSFSGDGYIPIGGFVATMQSLGTMGIYAGLNVITITIGCIAGMSLGGYKALYIDDFCGIVGGAPPPPSPDPELRFGF
ncbi:MAG: hypothetical protein BYD32DRAFT_165872 [Podila humilis]|nr:MAG: hypothetical protein BYD32DRAFT_165872 [Podila humilis]